MRRAYVVMEWVVGDSLLDMLSEGPLDPPRAAALVAEAAQAIASAHAAGLTHLRLEPACLHWTAGGGVKITGLGIDAALTGPELALRRGPGRRPELTDTRDLARLLYAALTGYWPADGRRRARRRPGLLPPAPEADGSPCTPRQVSAGVPASIDDVTCRALFQRPSRHGPALSTPAMFADALAQVAPPVPLPLPVSAPPPSAGPAATATAATQRRVHQSVPAARPGHASRDAGGLPAAARERSTADPGRDQRRDRARPGGCRRGRLVVQPQPQHCGTADARPAGASDRPGRRGRGRPAQAGQREQLRPARRPAGDEDRRTRNTR